MKKLLIAISIVFTQAIEPTKGNGIGHVEGDTVYIELGENKKIAIVVDHRDDLKSLEKYDLNKMISDLNIHADSVVFKGKRETPKKIKKNDTTYYFHRKKADIDISIANYKIEIKSDDFDDLGDDIEDFFEHYDKANKEKKLEDEIDKHQKGFDMDLGMNNWIGDGETGSNDLHSVKPWGSWYVALKRTHKMSTGGRGFINWGYGVSWYNWKFENRNTRIVKDDNAIMFTEDNSVDGLKSKLTASYLNLEIIPTIDYSFGKREVHTVNHGNVKITRYKKVGLRLGLGPYIGYRLGSKTKVVYKINGDKRKDKDHDNFYLNDLRYGLRAQVGFNRTDFFINYDFNNVFESGKGPSLNAISFGLVL